MHASNAILGEQFNSLEQQKLASTAGMWVFLSTEILFFGGLFSAYIVYRSAYPQQFAAGSHLTDILLGTLNTAVLLTSSFFMAFAVRSAQLGEKSRTTGFLAATIVLALAFLALKGLEYSEHISDHLLPGTGFRSDLPKPVELFFWLYFVMTGLHALHVFIGICVLTGIAIMNARGRFSTRYSNPVEISGLYWHFVDIVWVFLYPLFYLIHS